QERSRQCQRCVPDQVVTISGTCSNPCPRSHMSSGGVPFQKVFDGCPIRAGLVRPEAYRTALPLIDQGPVEGEDAALQPSVSCRIHGAAGEAGNFHHAESIDIARVDGLKNHRRGYERALARLPYENISV